VYTDHPLAKDFALGSGYVSFAVPEVKSGKYFVVREY
jgi:hypothetical protein